MYLKFLRRVSCSFLSLAGKYEFSNNTKVVVRPNQGVGVGVDSYL